MISLLLLPASCLAFGATGSNRPVDWMTPGSQSGQIQTILQPDYLNPYSVGRPDWDPYGPGGYGDAFPRAAWDPYSPSATQSWILELADPAAVGLTINDDPRTANQLFLQQGPILTTQGTVVLGDPIVLWLRVLRPGPLILYDSGQQVYSSGFAAAGWYRLSGGHAEILSPHIFAAIASGRASNNVSIRVDPGGYNTANSLVGRVVDPLGRGIPGVSVLITNNEGGRFSRTTDMFGYYGMDLPSGYYVIQAQYPGFAFGLGYGRVWLGTVSAATTIVGVPEDFSSSAGPAMDGAPPV